MIHKSLAPSTQVLPHSYRLQKHIASSHEHTYPTPRLKMAIQDFRYLKAPLETTLGFVCGESYISGEPSLIPSRHPPSPQGSQC